MVVSQTNMTSGESGGSQQPWPAGIGSGLSQQPWPSTQVQICLMNLFQTLVNEFVSNSWIWAAAMDATTLADSAYWCCNWGNPNGKFRRRVHLDNPHHLGNAVQRVNQQTMLSTVT